MEERLKTFEKSHFGDQMTQQLSHRTGYALAHLSWIEDGRVKTAAKFSELRLPVDLFDEARREGFVVGFTDTRYHATVGKYGVGQVPCAPLAECFNLDKLWMELRHR